MVYLVLPTSLVKAELSLTLLFPYLILLFLYLTLCFQYISCLVVVIILQITAGILGAVFQEKLVSLCLCFNNNIATQRKASKTTAPHISMQNKVKQTRSKEKEMPWVGFEPTALCSLDGVLYQLSYQGLGKLSNAQCTILS